MFIQIHTGLSLSFFLKSFLEKKNEMACHKWAVTLFSIAFTPPNENRNMIRLTQYND